MRLLLNMQIDLSTVQFYLSRYGNTFLEIKINIDVTR